MTTHRTANPNNFSYKDEEDEEDYSIIEEPSWKEIAIAEVVAETPKAILVAIDSVIPETGEILSTNHWFPLSQVHKIIRPCKANDYKGILRAEFWLLKKKGLV